ncbi:MAG: hypothetical protein CMH22_01870 [Methylophaga sp.]|uniref:DUF6776 family protein n=1 Tax=Methylophaga sp. UBA678 TaxID=1946901 RepID=UPI000C4790C8|nr:DUF6776 family protein [Methylophaga sp. UBA678]MAX50712.1 hypothetical protein [Methylophaga sp.]|tara:strand:- start:2331 stop:3023 length:693 start_codon:yes stop_codon:yes gene_type:complete
MIDKPYVIHHRRPYRTLLILLITLAISAALLWYWTTQWQNEQNAQITALKEQNEQLHAENQNLLEQNKLLTAQVNDISRMQAMQDATDSQLQSNLERLQNQVIELNKELLFYQNITQGNASSELQIRELHLRPNPDNPSQYFYRIVITQGKKISKAIKGDVLVALQFNDDKAKPRLINTHGLKLKHVQVLEGTLNIEQNEQPKSLKIELKQGKKTLTTRTFNWEVTPSLP